ncbi:MAG: hypothetical protein ACYDCK_10085 [Thermoplasmatota archaeon]
MTAWLRPLTVIAVCLVAPALLAGCNVKDWYNGAGVVDVYLGSAPLLLPHQPDAGENAIVNFSSFFFGVTLASVHPVDEVKNVPTIKWATPVPIDLVTRYNQGKGLLVFHEVMPTKTIDSADVTLVLASAKLVNGTTIRGCEQPLPKTRPCISIEPSGHYTFDRTANPIDMQRGKTLVIDFPLAVRYVPDGTYAGDYQLTSRTQEGSVDFTSCTVCFS